MSQEKIKNIIEAVLMVSTQPISVTKLLNIFEAEQSMQPERNDIKAALEAIQNDYQEHGIELVEVASGFRFQARDEYADWVNHLFDERPPRYSRALLETLAIIAYRQPITRGEIEEIRGVSVSSTIVKTLQEREWVKIVGHRDVPGKPALLATTKTFLDYFNLKKLSELPSLEDIKDFDAINPDLFEELEGEVKANEDGNAAENKEESEETISEDNEEVVASDSEQADSDDVEELNSVDDASDNSGDDETQAEAEEELELEEESEQQGATVVPFTN
jgi:segregation and condensation protein B